MRRRFLVLGYCTLVALGCGAGAGPLAPLAPGGHHVLFIGNSLTYVNDLPGTLSALAASAGDTIRVSTVAKPDFALIDHLNGGSDALEAIRVGGWEYVVLQQGSSSLPANRDSLVLWTKMFDPYIRAVGATPALYMVWPTADRREFFDAVRASYLEAAQAVHGAFWPAGAAWVAAWSRDSTLPLYAGDGLHPSPMGTYLAALVMYERITGHDARRLPGQAVVQGRTLAASEATVRLLQEAAHETNQQAMGESAPRRVSWGMRRSSWKRRSRTLGPGSTPPRSGDVTGGCQ